MKKVQAVIDIEEVADKCGECKENHAYRNKDRAVAAELGNHGLLHVDRTGGPFRDGHARAQAHHSRCRANEQCVEEYREHLYEALLDRVTYIGRSRRIRGGTDAGFIRIKAAFYAVHKARAGNTAEDGPKIEGIGKNHHKNVRQNCNMRYNDKIAAST